MSTRRPLASCQLHRPLSLVSPRVAPRGPCVIPHERRVTAEDKVASWLYRLATGATFLQCSQQFDMSVSYTRDVHIKVSTLFMQRY